MVVVFSLISAASFVVLVRQAVKNGKRSLMKTFLVHSTLRMLAAAALIVVYANIKGWIHAEEKKSLLAFVILFAVFYLILLIFDVSYMMLMTSRAARVKAAIIHNEYFQCLETFRAFPLIAPPHTG